jgi:predicted nuclease of predicted toxin-antitoxin system
MKRILLDQGLPATAVTFLREDGWDVLHVREVQMRDAADSDILAYAARESRVVFTLDRDFPEMLALTGAVRPSVVLIRQQGLRAAEVAGLVKAIFHENEVALDQGCVIKASARGTRVRLLPLR